VGDGDEEVHIKPRLKNEINLSTVGLLFGMLVTAGGILYQTGQYAQQIDSVRGEMGRTQASLAAVQARLSQVDQLAYRIDARERGAAEQARVMDELRKAVAEQSADIRVIREILTRRDEAER
jgi:uncharacterized coiled-coil protein SlyX